jgi:hypothetical protein
MELVERYLAAVDAQLPANMREDVIAELRDTLLTRIEEMEAKLGRAVEHADVEAMLRDFGHPLVVAGRYRTHRHLIGPEVYPFYVVALQMVLGVLVFIYIIGSALNAFAETGPIRGVARILDNVAPSLLGAFAIVTIIFMIIERAGGGPGLARSWSPRALPGPASQRPRRAWETLAEMAFEAVFLLFWVGLIRAPMPPVAGIEVAPTQIWADVHTLILVVVAASLATNLLSILRPGWLWPLGAARTLIAFATIAVVIALVRADALFVLSSPDHDEAALANISFWTHVIFRIGLAGVALAGVGEATGALMRAGRGG